MNETQYRILRLLGKGKGGYSYLAEREGQQVVVKQIHHEPYLPLVRDMAAKAMAAGLNIDYYPTNFVVQEGLLWYVDYECNDYSEQWDFEHWGIRYWSRTPEFEVYLMTINPRSRSGKNG